MKRTEMSVPYGRSRILLVDDEAEILVALTDLLEDEFDILSSTDPVEALGFLRKSPDIAVIVSDQRMPNMTGDVLLSKAREFSDARGILLTGYADLAAVVAALNQGRIQFYAHKPWDSDSLRAMVREVAAHHRLERALMVERVLLHGALESVPMDVVFTESDGTVLRHNMAADVEPNAKGDIEENALHGEALRDEIVAMREETKQTGGASRLVSEMTPDGLRWHEIIRQTLPWPRNASGVPLPMPQRWQMSYDRDVTERLAMEERLRQDDKMHALGTLAGGIAHDFNNLLTAMLGSLELLQDMTPAGNPTVTKLFENALESARRGTVLTRRLLEFGRPKPMALRPVDMVAMIWSMQDLIVQSLSRASDLRGETGRCVLDLSAVPRDLVMPHVLSDPGQLEMALLNLCINARDAMQEGGMIAISLIHESAQDGVERVMLDVKDQGCGMPPEVVRRIFEPFFTTKGLGSGTGLGLSTIYGFLQRSGGDIRVESVPGEGTRMTMVLPVCQEKIAEDTHCLKVEEISNGPLRILLADDEPGVRLVTEQFLSQDGNEVVSVGDGADVIAHLAAGERFDLVVLDLLMPGMGGRECGLILAANYPSLPVLYVSGYADPENLPANAFVLGKPFTPQELREAIATTLRQRR
ncbi:response regulator [Asaia krungthepensis]|uniref:histidine kinase n=1 Tax=Asaia krungthepensis NRIC 0535 TaxID=1307925 RepID=A0ABQ0PYB8_9PROT|nr:response regulator [Asaia krungthepensis]GBQ84632.1 two component hybrid sensor histidine kinase and regulator [Asaia krungthepensis NRIC 0535]